MTIARIVCVMAFVAWPMAGAAQSLLVPMDRIQENHLKAYGLTYWALEQYGEAEWLLSDCRCTRMLSGCSTTAAVHSCFPTWRVCAARLLSGASPSSR